MSNRNSFLVIHKAINLAVHSIIFTLVSDVFNAWIWGTFLYNSEVSLFTLW